MPNLVCGKSRDFTHYANNQWMAQGRWGALDIYQREITVRAVERDRIIEAVDDWFVEILPLADALFTVVCSD